MRLTRETLIKIARDAANQRAKVSRRITCIYLTGSVLEDVPLLGGTTDIDLIVIHDSEPIQPREVVRLSDEVHLDIGHYDQAVFHQPRHLRTDPWLGTFIYLKPMVLYDTHHWFDFIQASTGAQFFQPEYVVQRAGKLAQSARQNWLNLEFNPGESHANQVWNFLKVIEYAGNALACLSGGPITERRFFTRFLQRTQNLHKPELTAGLAHLLAPESAQWLDAWTTWLPEWKETYQTACSQSEIPVQLHPCRLTYYEHAIAAMWEENITSALWLLMRTWTLASTCLGSDHLENWLSAIQKLGLDENSFPARLQEMDHYLDQVEETIESWALANGVSSTAEI